MKNTKISCVIVTYNRLTLLQECLKAVLSQTFPLYRIIIIDNCSTDKTSFFLKSYENDPQFIIKRTEKNIGGAGGFSLGIKEAILDGADYVWIMDDDTIPHHNALDELAKVAYISDNVGFACSKVNWIDGNIHPRNKPGGISKNHVEILYNNNIKAYNCEVCTFVSVLINSKTVYRIGLPIKEFIIWSDDIEYTLRITKANYNNYYVESSVVIHKTPDIFNPTIEDAPINMANRFYYQTRNQCYIKHRTQSNKLLFRLSIWNKLRILKQRIKRRKDGVFEPFLEAVKKGCKDGLTFFPEIEYLQTDNDINIKGKENNVTTKRV